MNYQKIYDQLIQKAILECRYKTGYVEQHHILPRSLGGDDDPYNLVYLTAREHFVAHWLLIKMHTGENRKKMVHAFMCMKADRPNRDRYKTKVTSRIYEHYRNEYRDALVGRKRAPFSNEWRENMSKAHQGENNAMYGKKHSKEARQKMSEKAKQRKHSESTRQKIGAAQIGSKKPKKLCPHCDQMIAVNGYARWHGDKCKQKI